MAFVRKKIINGHEYYYLVSNERLNGKVRQKTIAQLGQYKTLDAAISGIQGELDQLVPVLEEFMRTVAESLQRHKALAAWMDATVYAPNQDELNMSFEEYVALGREIVELHQLDKEIGGAYRERTRQYRRAKRLRAKLQQLMTLHNL